MIREQYYSWNGVPVMVEWFDGPVDVSAYSSPAEHPTGKVPEGERHALVSLCSDRTSGWWASEDAVDEHTKPLGPTTGESSIGIDE